jgi:acyl carrier protein
MSFGGKSPFWTSLALWRCHGRFLELSRRDILRNSAKTMFSSTQIASKAWSVVRNKLLGRARVSTVDDIFELKGDSLLARQVISGLHQELSARLPVSLSLDYQNVRTLAAQLDSQLWPSFDSSVSMLFEGSAT